MGYDLYGIKNPSAYFRASVWSWGPIRKAIMGTGIPSKRDVAGMCENGGHRVLEAKALAIADALEARMDAGDGTILDYPSERIWVHETEADGLAKLCMDANCPERHFSVYSTTPEHFREFIRFCRESGGFVIW